MDSILAREYYNREILPETAVTDDEIKGYYDSHPDEFRDPEMVKARHILVRAEPDATREEWDKALRKATDLKKEIDNGADFEKLAREKSDDGSTKRKGGALRTGGAFGSGYLTRESMPEGFPDIVFSLKAGEISDPVKSPKGYHIIKVETKQPEKIQTLDQVKGTLKQKLSKQKHEELFAQTIERLKEKYKVVLNTDLLDSVKVEKKKKKGG
ncbi:MAG: peptidylprolyl isomerase [Thermodesulfobacteriota bacterium]|nr:peptidylprolyl isomerase [Thermodesulfobacteriota bacterium]